MLQLIQNFLGIGRKNPFAKMDFSEIPFLVIDTETTGLLPAKDKILSWAAVPLQNQRIDLGQIYYSQIRQETHYKAESASIHAILKSEGTENEKESLLKFYELAQDKVIVGHHIGFDISFLQKSLKPYGISHFQPFHLDTFYWAIRLDHGAQLDWETIKREEYGLDKLCEKYKIQIEDRHTAYGDALATAILFSKLLINAKKQGIALKLGNS